MDGEKVIGLFLNTLPLRLTLKGGRWIDLVQECFAAERELAPHRRFPLAEIQKLNGGRPMFEAAFDFVQFHVYNGLQGGINVREGCYFEANDLTAFTTFMLDASGTNLELHIDYDPNHLCRRQIEEMSAYYTNTLRALAMESESRYEDFSPMLQEEKDRLLVEWNQTSRQYPQDEGIHHLFERRAKENPDKTALSSENESWTFNELNRRANGVAQKLIEAGVGPNSLVGICMNRTSGLVAALLGILKVGAAYVPLDPAFPKDRLRLMLEDAKVQVLVTENNTIQFLPASDAKVLRFDSINFGKQASRTRLPSGAGDLAYVIYTSGSTGTPKGVQVRHGSVVNLLTSIGKTINFLPGDRMLSVTTLSFDIAALEIFLPLITGGELILASRDSVVDGTRLAKLIESSRATVMQATPTTWRLLIESGWSGQKGAACSVRRRSPVAQFGRRPSCASQRGLECLRPH